MVKLARTGRGCRIFRILDILGYLYTSYDSRDCLMVDLGRRCRRKGHSRLEKYLSVMTRG